ncbi:GDP-L-fucose synthase [Gammaproteobacteria bacterium]|nr:GDP-L-fucose synthase [Gammaproteobacteria bacterium]MDC0511103.1 GDP-L-fucose synthase [bacterium]
MKTSPKIYVAGHNGMVGSAIVRELDNSGQNNIITKDRSELDLTNQCEVKNFFDLEKPDQVYLAAAKVGGIHANNTYPANFIYENLMVESNVIHQAWLSGVKKLLFLGSSCIYPKLAIQPMSENALLSGSLEPTNEPYAIAKIAGIKLCESYNRQYDVDYRSVMPTNLYGSGDNYHPTNSHVIPALIRRFHEAKINNLSEVYIWGTGNAKREFLFVNDMAKACILVMGENEKHYKNFIDPMLSHINVGSGKDITIKELSYEISKCVGFKGNIKFDTTKPDGSPRKFMDSSKILSMGWLPEVDIADGLVLAYKDFCSSISNNRT